MVSATAGSIALERDVSLPTTRSEARKAMIGMPCTLQAVAGCADGTTEVACC